MMRRMCLLGLVVPLVLAAGCGTKLNMEYTAELPTEGKLYVVDALKSEQKIKVNVKAESPVDVFVYLDKDRDKVEGTLLGKASPLVLAQQKGASEVSIEATIPANEKAIVHVVPGKKGMVTTKITNR